MSEIKFQWVTPIGGVTPPMSLEESSELIRTGRVFPAQFVSLNGAKPTLAATQPSLQSAWMAVTPKETPFTGDSGRVSILTLGKLFAHCALNRLHGRLFVRHNDSGLHFMLRFASGQLIEVSALDPSTYFGQLCLQQQLVSAAQLMQAVECAKSSQTMLGQALVELNFLTPKQVNRLLAEQMFVRIRKIACFPHLDVCFCEDPKAAMIAPAARISGYSLLEITLGYGLPDHSIKSYVGDLMSRPIVINRKSPALRMISGEDREVLKKIHASGDLTPLTSRGDWTQRDGALKAIAWDLISIFEVPKSFALAREYAQIEGEQAFQYLGLERFSVPQETERLLREYAQRLDLNQPSENTEEERVKQAIRARLRHLAELAQGSERERRVYQRMQQIGADPSDEQLRQSLLFDSCIQEGEAALKRQRYEEARVAYADALAIKPDDMSAQLNEAWSQFLNSGRHEADFNVARDRFQSAIQRAPQSPRPLLFLAWLQRLYGQLKEAEQTLRQILEINPNHTEAQAELRLLYNREYDQKKRKVKVFQQANPETSQWMVALAVVAVITGIFWGLANLVPHSRSVWPEERPLNVSALQGLREFDKKLVFHRILRTNYKQGNLVSSAYQLGLKPHPRAQVVSGGDQQAQTEYTLKYLEGQEMREVERVLNYLYEQFMVRRELVLSTLKDSLVIPFEQRVLGNVEHYWLVDDILGWGRRSALILIGLIGFVRLRSSESEISFTPAVSISLLAIIYGSIVGFFSPPFSSSTPTGMLTTMKTLHSVGEVFFFQYFLGLTLLRGFQWSPWLPIVLVSSSVAIFKVSLLHVWFMDFDIMVLTVAQAGVFVGGGCLFFMWKSKSLVPPMIAHLTITFIPLLRGLA